MPISNAASTVEVATIYGSKRPDIMKCFMHCMRITDVATGACPGIRKRGAQNVKTFLFFFAFQFFKGGGPAQKLAEKMTFSTKKVAKCR